MGRFDLMDHYSSLVLSFVILLLCNLLLKFFCKKFRLWSLIKTYLTNFSVQQCLHPATAIRKFKELVIFGLGFPKYFILAGYYIIYIRIQYAWQCVSA